MSTFGNVVSLWWQNLLSRAMICVVYIISSSRVSYKAIYDIENLFLRHREGIGSGAFCLLYLKANFFKTSGICNQLLWKCISSVIRYKGNITNQWITFKFPIQFGQLGQTLALRQYIYSKTGQSVKRNAIINLLCGQSFKT